MKKTIATLAACLVVSLSGCTHKTPQQEHVRYIQQAQQQRDQAQMEHHPMAINPSALRAPRENVPGVPVAAASPAPGLPVAGK